MQYDSCRGENDLSVSQQAATFALQRVAACCSVLQRVALCCIVLRAIVAVWQRPISFAGDRVICVAA